MDALAANISALKCKASYFGELDLNEKNYGLKNCNISIFTFLDKINRKRLEIDLLENIQYLNYIDEFGKEIINCDLEKIKEFEK